MAALTRGPPTLDGYYVESPIAWRLVIAHLRRLLHISTVCA